MTTPLDEVGEMVITRPFPSMPVRKILMGYPTEKAASRDAMMNPVASIGSCGLPKNRSTINGAPRSAWRNSCHPLRF
jgi:hypothetical protein